MNRLLPWFLVAIFNVTTLLAVAQSSARIIPRKIVIKHKNSLKPIKQAVVRYPVVSGLPDNTVQRKINSVLSLNALFKGTNGSTFDEMKQDDWIDEADYEVNYNRNGLLDIAYSIAGSAAYPDGSTRHFVIDLQTGKLLKARDLFTSAGMREMVKLADAQMQAAIRSTLQENKEEREHLTEQLKNVHFTLKDLDHFSLNAKGITFIVDFGFPHVIQALEPDGEYFLPYARIKTALRPDSPLRRITR